MDQQFTLLAQEADMLCRDYFGKRLAACYLHGSIAMGDAIAGISDLDYYVVLSESLTEEDPHGCKACNNAYHPHEVLQEN